MPLTLGEFILIETAGATNNIFASLINCISHYNVFLKILQRNNLLLMKLVLVLYSY